MDVEKLIALVQERRCLWDTSSKAYHNRDNSRRKWSEIAEIMNIESGVIKAKWGNLRDMFRKEHTKLMKQPTGSEAKKTCPWKFYDILSFLTDVFKPRQMICSMDAPLMVTYEDVDEETEVEQQQQQSVPLETTLPDTGSEIDAGSSSGSGTFKEPAAKKAKQSKANTVAQFLALEARKVEQLEQIKRNASSSSSEVHDEDYHFLMSLLPHFREIPADRKLLLRIRIQQLLLEEKECCRVTNPPSDNL